MRWPWRRRRFHIELYLLEDLMAKIDDLTAAVNAQGQAIADLAARIDAIPRGTPDAALQPVIDAVVAQTAQLQSLAPSA